MTDDTAAAIWGVEEGYHDIFGKWHQADSDTVAKLVAAISSRRSEPAVPQVPVAVRAFQGDGSRRWGLAVQLYAVRSARNWGIGDFTDLAAILDIAARSGASAVGLNPLHALFLDRPESCSPYSPNSRLFFNALYIDVEEVVEFDESMVSHDALDQLRSSAFVDYAGVARAKEHALRLCYDRFLRDKVADRHRAFANFKSEQGAKLTHYAAFEVLRRKFGQAPWRQWPEPWNSPTPEALERLRAEEDIACGFFEYTQWLADEQLADCARRAKASGLATGLYLDLAVGVDPGGADAWSNQNAVLSQYSIGAPPDEFNPAGQDWGLAPFNPHALAENNFAIFRELLGAAMRHAGAVRLDHVLGLMRLYLVPHGASAEEGAYIRYPFEQLLRVVAEESQRYRCAFIGEDLGTVPDGFRETAARYGIWSYRVMMFERSGDGEFKPPHEYPVDALATLNTHDLPTFRGWITGKDLEVKRALNLDPGESDESRHHAREAFRRAVSRLAGEFAGNELAASAFFLGSSPARLVMVSAEDMLELEEQVNIPGTIDQHPNWRRKLPRTVEEWGDGDTWQRVSAALNRAGRGDLR